MMTDIREHFLFLEMAKAQLADDQLLSRTVGQTSWGEPVLLGLDPTGRHRLLVPTMADVVDSWTTAGMTLTRREWGAGQDKRPYLDLVCLQPHLETVFASLARDVLERVVSVPEGKAIAAMTSVLEEWKALFSKPKAGMSDEDQLGLFAELAFLELLGDESTTGALAAWSSWRRGAAYRDFQRNDLAVEVKATSAHTGGSISVHGLGQLDPTVPGLHIHVVRIERGPSGITLSERLEDLVSRGFGRAELWHAVEVRGYSPGCEELRMTQVEQFTWRLHPGMAFLGDGDLPEFKRNAVEHLTYSLPLAAMADPPLGPSEVETLLEGMVGDTHVV